MAKEAKKNVVKDEVKEEVVFGAVVEQHLDRDLNDPRLQPIVDGNSQPVIDINVPQ